MGGHRVFEIRARVALMRITGTMSGALRNQFLLLMSSISLVSRLRSSSVPFLRLIWVERNVRAAGFHHGERCERCVDRTINADADEFTRRDADRAKAVA